MAADQEGHLTLPDASRRALTAAGMVRARGPLKLDLVEMLAAVVAFRERRTPAAAFTLAEALLPYLPWVHPNRRATLVGFLQEAGTVFAENFRGGEAFNAALADWDSEHSPEAVLIALSSQVRKPLIPQYDAASVRLSGQVRAEIRDLDAIVDVLRANPELRHHLASDAGGVAEVLRRGSDQATVSALAIGLQSWDLTDGDNRISLKLLAGSLRSADTRSQRTLIFALDSPTLVQDPSRPLRLFAILLERSGAARTAEQLLGYLSYLLGGRPLGDRAERTAGDLLALPGRLTAEEVFPVVTALLRPGRDGLPPSRRHFRICAELVERLQDSGLAAAHAAAARAVARQQLGSSGPAYAFRDALRFELSQRPPVHMRQPAPKPSPAPRRSRPSGGSSAAPAAAKSPNPSPKDKPKPNL